MSETLIPEEKREFAPLPEIVIPDGIKTEREEGIGRLLNNPPLVDCILVLGRSGTLAASGLYGRDSFVGVSKLPPMIVVDGIGNELFHMWSEYIDNNDLEEQANPTFGLGDDSDEEIRAHFASWVESEPNEYVSRVLRQLEDIRKKHPSYRSFALVDDIRNSGNVSMSIAPALFKNAFGVQFEYNPENNIYIFQNPLWIWEIVKASFEKDVGKLTERQIGFLSEIAKGSIDWPSVGEMALQDREELDVLAEYFETKYLAQETNSKPNAVKDLVDRYGQNLLQLNRRVVVALVAHAEIVLKKRKLSDGVLDTAAQ